MEIFLDQIGSMSEPLFKVARGFHDVHGARNDSGAGLGSQREGPAMKDCGRVSAEAVLPACDTRQPGVRADPGRLQLVLIEGGVLLDEFFLVFGHILESVNRVRGTRGDAGPAIDAAFGIDVHLRGGLELWLVLLGMDAIGWANLDTQGVFDAVISDYVCHDESISGSGMSIVVRSMVSVGGESGMIGDSGHKRM